MGMDDIKNNLGSHHTSFKGLSVDTTMVVNYDPGKINTCIHN